MISPRNFLAPSPHSHLVQRRREEVHLVNLVLLACFRFAFKVLSDSPLSSAELRRWRHSGENISWLSMPHPTRASSSQVSSFHACQRKHSRKLYSRVTRQQSAIHQMLVLQISCNDLSQGRITPNYVLAIAPAFLPPTQTH